MASSKYSKWEVEDVCLWLKNNGIPADVVECFRREKISGYCLSELQTENIIIETCKGVDLKVGIRVKLKKLIFSLMMSEADNESSTFSRSPSVSGQFAYEVESVSETSSTRSNEPRSRRRSVVDAAKVAEVESNNNNNDDECELKLPVTDVDRLLKQGTRLSAAHNAFGEEIILEASSNGRLPTKAPSVASSLSLISTSSANPTMSTMVTHPAIVAIEGLDFVKLRSFEDDAAAAVSYCEGGIVENIYFSDYADDPLLPRHRFVDVDLSLNDVTRLHFFCEELARFACACLQCASNGTIHFGVREVTDQHGRKCGQVVGVSLENFETLYENQIAKIMKQCLSIQHQTDTFSSSVVSKALFITVDSTLSNRQQMKYVVEFDIVPPDTMNNIHMVAVADPVISNSQITVTSETSVYYFAGKTIKKADDDVTLHGIKNLFAQSIQKRINAKLSTLLKVRQSPDSTLRKQLIWQMCLGEDKLLGDIYPVLVLSKPEKYMKNGGFVKENFHYISSIKWKAIFDFDNEALICNYFQAENMKMRIIATCNEFESKNVHDDVRLKRLHQTLQTADEPPWLFVNGYSSVYKQQTITDWKQDSRDGFRAAVKFFFKSVIPPGREIIVYLMLSGENDLLLECSDLIEGRNFLFIGQDNKAMKQIIKILVRKQVITDTAKEKFIIGMPWCHVQATMQEITATSPSHSRLISSSSGANVILKESFINLLSDLEILASNECDNIDDAKEKENLEFEFYHGLEVSWWNFWCQNHVVERDMNNELMQRILHDLQQNTLENIFSESFVSVFFLYHHPGAGATTVAKQVLWNLRKSYRCAIVRKITDQTVDQIIKLHSYEEPKNAKPLMLLFDALDEEHVLTTLRDLNEQAKRRARDIDQGSLKFAVCLVCIKRTTLPKFGDIDIKRCFLLEQKLSKRELKVFTEKFANLEKSAEQYDPKLLISLNIMKSNFNVKAIEKLVCENYEGMQSPTERRLLKLLAFINTYDLNFSYLPTAAFNSLMGNWVHEYERKNTITQTCQTADEARRSKEKCSLHQFAPRWETKMSSELCNLTNQTTTVNFGEIKSIRLAHPLLSKIALKVVCEKEQAKPITVGEIAKELLTVDIKYATAAERKLLDVIIRILTVRQIVSDGKKDMFSPLILELRGQSIDLAAEVLQMGYELTNNAYVAQHLARLYIVYENWLQAIRYSELAVEDTDPSINRSSLTDTCGRVYLNQLQKEYTKLTSSKVSYTRQRLHSSQAMKIIKLANKALQYFRKTQELAYTNDAGYYGEVQTTILLLDCLNYSEAFNSREKIQAFIVDDQYFPDELKQWNDENGDNIAIDIKKWVKDAQGSMTRIENFISQFAEDTLLESSYKRAISINYIQKLRLNLMSYCGESSDEPPPNYNDQMKCAYRRRRIHTLGGESFSWNMENTTKDNCTNLERIIELAKENLKFPAFSSGEDYKALITASLLLFKLSKEIKFRYDFLVDLSNELYRRRQTISKQLEPYLFYCMLRWPRPNVSARSLFASSRELTDAMSQWKEAYYDINPQQKRETNNSRKKDKTVFYFATGHDLASIVSFKTLISFCSKTEDVWGNPKVKSTLQRFVGILCADGEEVIVTLKFPSGNCETIQIPASFPIRRPSLWNKTVYLAIGFSWLGPKAFDISHEKPADWVDEQEHSLNPVSKNAENLFSASPLQPPESSEGAAQVVNAGASAAATVTGIAADASSKKKQPRTELNCITHDDLRHELDRIRGKLQEIHDMIARAERSAQTRKLKELKEEEKSLNEQWNGLVKQRMNYLCTNEPF